MKTGRFVQMLLVLAGLCLGGETQAGETPAKSEAAIMTLQDLQLQGMTSFVDKEFMLRAKVMWEYAAFKIPEDPTPDDALRKQASAISIPLEGIETKDAKRARGIHLSGSDLARQADAQGREEFVFQKTSLSNNDKEYVMTVRLKLRPAFNKTHLANPAFVKQSNNPTYWSQTFEFELMALREAP